MLPAIQRGLRPRLFSSLIDDDFFSNFFDEDSKGSVPAVNIFETKDDFRIEVAAPGYKKDEFKIDLDRNVLTISSEREEKKEDEDKKLLRCEYNYRSFSRAFTLPQSANLDKVDAKHENGVLTVIIQKREDAKEKPARQISIK